MRWNRKTITKHNWKNFKDWSDNYTEICDILLISQTPLKHEHNPQDQTDFSTICLREVVLDVDAVTI